MRLLANDPFFIELFINSIPAEPSVKSLLQKVSVPPELHCFTDDTTFQVRLRLAACGFEPSTIELAVSLGTLPDSYIRYSA